MHLPFKHGLKCADMIFLGGQVSLDKKGQAVRPGDLVAQTDAAMNHIGTILRDLGADYRDICKLTTFYQSAGSLADLQSINSVYSTVFSDKRPVASAVALPTLSYPEMVVEIDTFAMAEPDPEHGLPPQ